MGNFFSSGVDYLGLRTALADRLLPILVGAMSFMAALALAGALAAASLAAQWQADTTTALTVQVPDPQAPSAAPALTRLADVEQKLRAAPGVTGLHLLTGEEETKLLQPWLGQDVGALALPVPAVFTATWSGGDSSGLARALQAAAPGALVETGTAWASRAKLLTASLQDCAEVLLLIVALVAAAIVSVATASPPAPRCWPPPGRLGGRCWRCSRCWSWRGWPPPSAPSACMAVRCRWHSGSRCPFCPSSPL
jgi:cell division transport system permease protein